jgi:hypothetical protein
MEARSAVSAELAEIERRLAAEGHFGSIRVVAVRGELTTDHDGDPVVRLRLTLSDPPAGQATWPLDDVDVLRQEVERLVSASSVDLPYVVFELYPESPDPDEADDASDDLAEALDRDPDS